MAVFTTVKIHPCVLFSIVDSYERRNEDYKRSIGTLLGTVDKGCSAIEVTDSFTVPFIESKDEVAIDMKFARTMYDLHHSENPSEVIVGWYSTGQEITEHSTLIHEYYCHEAASPIHLTLDTQLRGQHMGVRAYTSKPIGVPVSSRKMMFTPLKVEITQYDSERIAMEYIQQGKHNSKRQVSLTSDLQMVGKTCTRLQEMLAVVRKYVDDVVAGRVAADVKTGRALMELVNSVPKIDPKQFEDMLNDNMKDLLMVVYLSNLTRTQLILHEKLNAM